jgi:acyl-CoA thioesterase YciA
MSSSLTNSPKDAPLQANAQAPGTKELVLKVIPMPSDCNQYGHIFGGWVMAQVDLAGSVLPFRLIGGRIVTIAVKEFVFKEPVFVGDLLSFYSRITRLGKTSITVDVEVFSERLKRADPIKVTQATLTYVAVDDEGRPKLIQN